VRKILFADSHYFNEYSMLGQRQYALQFAKHGWNTAYITNPLSPFSTILGNNKKLILDSLLNHIKNGEKINEHLWYYVPFTFIPYHNHVMFDKKWFMNNYYKFTVPSIKSILKKMDLFSVDVLWLGTPHQKFLQDILDYRCCIYRVCDNLNEFSNSHDVLLQTEEEVIQSSDYVLVASKILLEELKNRFRNKEFIYCPNGVDLSNFVRNQYNKPKEYRLISNRIALYIGAISEWFDRELLVNIARQCPEVTFVIIGIDRLGKMKNPIGNNVIYLGPKKHSEIANYIYYCDCGIIPFDNSKLVQSISPIKMYEFFSLGKPVISRAWEELKLLDSPCLLANNVSEFVELLKDRNTFSTDSAKLIRYAKENTWNMRFSYIEKVLKQDGF